MCVYVYIMLCMSHTHIYIYTVYIDIDTIVYIDIVTFLLAEKHLLATDHGAEQCLFEDGHRIW